MLVPFPHFQLQFQIVLVQLPAGGIYKLLAGPRKLSGPLALPFYPHSAQSDQPGALSYSHLFLSPPALPSTCHSIMGFKEFIKRRSLRAPDDKRTKAAELTLRQSIYPICLVTVLFFLWGFSYGLLDTLNKHFQDALGIEKSRSAGLQAAYFG